jgi:hypothetical protein
MELTIAVETVCRIILRAREYEALVPAPDPEIRSNLVDDGEVDDGQDDELLDDDLLDEGENPVEQELRSAIDDLAEDEQAELFALALIGRGSYDAGEWPDALQAAQDDGRSTSDFLLSLPMLGAYLDNGLAAMGLSCDGLGQLA